VQRKFLKYLYFKVHKYYPSRGYPHSDLLSEFNFTTLETRRKCSDLLFLKKVCNNVVYVDATFVPLIRSAVRENCRHKSIFAISHSNTNLHRYSLKVRLCCLANKCADIMDVSTISSRKLTVMIKDGRLDSVL